MAYFWPRWVTLDATEPFSPLIDPPRKPLYLQEFAFSLRATASPPTLTRTPPLQLIAMTGFALIQASTVSHHGTPGRFGYLCRKLLNHGGQGRSARAEAHVMVIARQTISITAHRIDRYLAGARRDTAGKVDQLVQKRSK